MLGQLVSWPLRSADQSARGGEFVRPPSPRTTIDAGEISLITAAECCRVARRGTAIDAVFAWANDSKTARAGDAMPRRRRPTLVDGLRVAVHAAWPSHSGSPSAGLTRRAGEQPPTIAFRS